MLVKKNRVARIAVVRDRKDDEPCAPKTVAEAPLPKADWEGVARVRYD